MLRHRIRLLDDGTMNKTASGELIKKLVSCAHYRGDKEVILWRANHHGGFRHVSGSSAEGLR